MKYVWRKFSLLFPVLVLCLQLCSCGGDSPWRYSPPAPEQPVNLAATADNAQVLLSWPAAANAAAYNVYYSTTAGVSKSNGTKIASVASTSYILSGLTNGATYYIVVTSLNSSGESPESNQISATPAILGSYLQSDLEGSWNFNILVSGAGAGWMRGALNVDNAGAVTFASFLDSSGHIAPPADLFPVMLLSSNGHVRDAVAGSPLFQGVMAANRKMVIGNSSTGSVSPMLVIMQKQVPGVTFSNSGDLQGFGNTGGGGRRFIYNQISSGSGQEWEFAEGQIGKDQKIQYATFKAPSNPVKPGDKSSILNISADGLVTESLTGALPQPATVISRGVMSADKSVIAGVATDLSGASPRYVLRIYQMVNITFNDLNTFTQADLVGSYNLQKLMVGSSSLAASGNLTINASGAAAYSSYLDSNGAAALPADFGMTVDANGYLSNAVDSSLLGKLSYFKDMFVITGTDSAGAYSLSIALKQ